MKWSMEEQEEAFERELHALCTRYFDEFDISPWSMFEILETEKLFLLNIMDAESEDNDELYGW